MLKPLKSLVLSTTTARNLSGLGPLA